MAIRYGSLLCIIVILVFKNFCVEALSNVALGKPAFQTGALNNYGAPNAVDGDTNGFMFYGSCIETPGGSASGVYWEVDLEDVYIIDHIILYNRMDCCGERTRNVQVFVGFDQQDYVLSAYLEGELGSSYTFQMDVQTYGRWVRISRDSVDDALNFCEVEVYATLFTEFNDTRSSTLLSNVALGKPAFQTNTYEEYNASKAVDGNTHGYMSGSYDSCMHTNGTDAGEYWEVDLEDVYIIDHIILYNRMDCCGERTRNVQVFVGFDQQDYVLSAYLEGELGSSYTFQMGIHTYGRWVRISRDSVDDALNFCEVKVYAKLLTKLDNVRFEVLSNRIGVDTLLNTIPNSSQIFCAALCKSSINCVGFNFDTSTSECKTFGTPTNPSDNIPEHLSFYHKG